MCMKVQPRNDIHRPSVLIPADYAYVMDFSNSRPELLQPAFNRDEANAVYRESGAQIHGGIFQCDICGAVYTYGTLFIHRASQEVISVGHDCADKLELLRDSAAADSLFRQAKAASLQALERAERRGRLFDWARANRSLLRDLKVRHGITADIRGKLIRTGAKWGLSEKQVALVRKLAADSRQPVEKHVPVPISDERMVVSGTVVSFRAVDSEYGTSFKITVKVATSEGSWLVYGTAPSSILDGTNVVGSSVQFTAKVVRGERDAHFGFFSRPTKATRTAA